MSKIAECCVFNQIFEFIADKIYHLQHGFVQGRSTITQLLDTVHLITKATDQGKQTDIAFLDFTKAFDSVSHPHLLCKLEQYEKKNETSTKPKRPWNYDY